MHTLVFIAGLVMIALGVVMVVRGYIAGLVAWVPVALWGLATGNGTGYSMKWFWVPFIVDAIFTLGGVFLTVRSPRKKRSKTFVKILGLWLVGVASVTTCTSVQTWPWTGPPPPTPFVLTGCPQLLAAKTAALQLQAHPIGPFDYSNGHNDVEEIDGLLAGERSECVPVDTAKPAAKFTVTPLPDGRSVLVDASASTGVKLSLTWDFNDPNWAEPIVKGTTLWNEKKISNPSRFTYTYIGDRRPSGQVIVLDVDDDVGQSSVSHLVP